MTHFIKFNRIGCLVIALIVLLGGITAFAEECEITASGTYEEINWTVYADGELYISGEGEMGRAASSNYVNIPWHSYKADVTKITVAEGITNTCFKAFEGFEKVKEAHIADSVLLIAQRTFYNCKGLEKVFIGSGVKKIESYAFSNCNGLNDIYYSGDVAGWCDIDTYTVATSVPTYYAKNLYIDGKQVYGKLVIPEGVTKIGNNAFYNCTDITSITIPKTVNFIGDNAFFNTGYYNDFANWDNGLLYIGTNLVAVDNEKLADECRLFTKTTLIASRVFNGSTVTSVDMADNVEYINDYAFIKCSELETVNLSDNLKVIGKSAFHSCAKLKTIEIPESVTALPSSVFYGAEALGEVIMADGLESIGEKAFYNTRSLKSVDIPATVKQIDATAFEKSGVTDIYYNNTKAEWKRATAGETFAGITVHYTLRNEDSSVIIQHTDENFSWEAGNVHLDVCEVTPVSPKYDRNGYYIKNEIEPIKVLEIKIVDGDSNAIQPLDDEKIIVKIKAPDRFMEFVSSSILNNDSIDSRTLEFSEGMFSYEQNGERISVNPTEESLNKFKIVHWFSDGTEPGDYEVFTHSGIKILKGYIILETNHFSEYAVCTEYTPKKDYTIKWIVDGVVTEQTVTEESAITKPANPEKEGYTFVGWTPEVPDTMLAENLEFSAVWQVNKYTVTFDTAGGTAIAPVSFEYGAAIISPANPEKDGYTFIGWAPELPETMPANDLTVVAVYEEIKTPEAPEPPKVTVKGVRIVSLPHKTQYTYKVDSLDLSGLVIRMTYSDGSSKIISDTKAITAYGFDVDSVGTKTITVACGGYTDEFEITVSYAWWQWIIRILLLGFIWY